MIAIERKKLNYWWHGLFIIRIIIFIIRVIRGYLNLLGQVVAKQ